MITRRRASLGGVQLDEIDERIIIQGIEPQAGKDNIGTVSLWGADGSRVTGRHRDYLEISVKFSLDIKRDAMAERSEVFEKIMAWAMAGGWLETSIKPERRIRVICTQLPAEGDPLEWTNRYSITFGAYGVPYWQDATANQVRKSGFSSGTVSFSIGGNMPTVMEAQFKNESGAQISNFLIQTGTKKIDLRTISLKNAETLVIDHDDSGDRFVLRIRIVDRNGEYRSVLNKRTAESSDDLILSPGIASVKVTTDRAGTLTLSSAGRYA